MQTDDVVADIERAFGSLAAPNFGEVGRRLAEGPPERLLAELQSRFDVSDTTDPNDEHGWCLVLSRDGRDWALNLAVVGPYAALARISTGWDEVLTAGTGGLTAEERWVIERLTAHRLRLLTEDELSRPVPLRLFNTRDVRLYQALFTDTEILPWDRDTHQRLGLD